MIGNLMTLFDMKKIAFENAVRRCSKDKGLDPPPSVSITENPCPFSTGEIAHIHIEERIICIWKKKLEELTLDQINTVAAHEVAHLISIEHGGRHAQAQAELEIADWGRSIGGVVIHGGQKVASSTPDKPIKPRRREKICSYHSCNKRTDLGWCPYCEKFFCKEHLKPKRPRLPPFKQRGIVGRINMGIWRGSGHPCPPYYDYQKAKKKEDLEKRWKALDFSSGRGRRRELVEMPHHVERVETPIERSRMHRFVISTILIIAMIIIIFALIWLSPAGF